MPPGMEEFFRPFRGMPGPGCQGPRRSEFPGLGLHHLRRRRDPDQRPRGRRRRRDPREAGRQLREAGEADRPRQGLRRGAAEDRRQRACRPCRLGDSSKLEVGDWVLAIGSPFGLEHTATQGIVSAVGRSLPDGNYVPFIQTDVAVNPGNSGGPLFNINGEVVGINSQIYSRSGGYMGLSFAIPVNTATSVARQLAANGRVERGWLGVGIQNVNGDLAKSFGLDEAGRRPGRPGGQGRTGQQGRPQARRRDPRVQRQADQPVRRSAAARGRDAAGHEGGAEGLAGQEVPRDRRHRRAS